jgi:hypothetical protein
VTDDADEHWSAVRTRADAAYHDVAQLHLHEFDGAERGVSG